MAFQYNPKDASTAWPAEDYDAEVVTVEEGESKSSGKPMLTIGIRCYNKAGEERTIKDYIVVPASLFKLKQLAQSLGMGKQFDAGTLDPYELKGRRLSVTLKVDSDEQYGDKNSVKKYASAKGGTSAQKSPITTAIRERSKAAAATVGSPADNDDVFEDEDIPF